MTNATAYSSAAQPSMPRQGPATPPAILADIRFRQLVQSRRRFSWTLTASMLAAYFAFIFLIALAPGILGTPIVAGHPTTWGIPIGVGMLGFTFALVAIYVHRANTVFDTALDTIRREEQS